MSLTACATFLNAKIVEANEERKVELALKNGPQAKTQGGLKMWKVCEYLHLQASYSCAIHIDATKYILCLELTC